MDRRQVLKGLAAVPIAVYAGVRNKPTVLWHEDLVSHKIGTYFYRWVVGHDHLVRVIQAGYGVVVGSSGKPITRDLATEFANTIPHGQYHLVAIRV